MNKTKKIFGVIFAAIILISIFTLCSFANGEADLTPEGETFTVLLGDVDLDGKITAADARYALRMSIRLDGVPYLDFPNDKIFILRTAAADINKNGKITAANARKILRIAVRLEADYEPEYVTVTIPETIPEFISNFEITGTVLENDGKTLFVKADEEAFEIIYSDKVYVSIEDTILLDADDNEISAGDIAVGEKVRIYFDGFSHGSGPSQISDCVKLQIL